MQLESEPLGSVFVESEHAEGRTQEMKAVPSLHTDCLYAKFPGKIPEPTERRGPGSLPGDRDWVGNNCMNPE